MPSPIVTATTQAAVLSGISNIMAQVFQIYKGEGAFSLLTLIQFLLFTLITCPPNFLWQEYLEETFPANFIGSDGSKQLHKTNTAKKFFLDQTIGAVVNTAAFLAFKAAKSGQDSLGIQRTIRREMLPLIITGWKLWPLVSIVNFTVVPMQQRILVGSLVGLFWNIYLSLLAAR